MFKNYINIAFRRIVKFKTYSIINILGLAIGISCFILIMLWIQDELSYDRFHKNANQIYRIGLKGNINGNDIQSSTTPGKWGPTLQDAFPEILNFTRYVPQERKLFKYNQKSSNEDGGAIADESILEMFDFPLIHGNPQTALANPLNMVITEKIAAKYFENEDPLNKTIFLGDHIFIITGVMKDIPHNSHIQFDFICSIDLLEKIKDGRTIDWYSDNFSTYLLFGTNVNVELLNDNICTFILEKAPFYKQIDLSTFIQPFTNIYLNPNVDTYFGVYGDMRYIYIFTIIAFFILFIACINYMNLTTALSTVRNKEVGIRKVVGSNQKQLILQFLSESFIMCLIAYFLAIILVELLLPNFNQLAGKNIQFNYSNPLLLCKLIIIMIGTGLVAGCYPAFYLSNINPISTLKASNCSSVKGKKSRRTMVITQFTISIILIIGTLCIYNQIVFMKNKELGFTKNNILYIPTIGEIGKKYDIVEDRLLKNPHIADITSKSCPLTYSNDASVVIKEGQDVKDAVYMRFLRIDYNFIDFMELELISGRNFSKNFSTDVTSACIMNEEAMRLLGLKDEIGTTVHTGQNETRTVVGVVKNAHFSSLKDQTEPRLYRPLTDLSSHDEGIILIKIKDYPAKEQKKIYTNVLSSINKLWKELNPGYPFEYHFLYMTYDQLYKEEERFSKILLSFALVAILLSCLGLFGLAAFTAERRTKEIGIRKVLGASVSGIVALLSKQFIKWVLLANIIAWPIAWYAMNKWLQNFAYRINIGLWTFLLAGMLALMIALVTVSFQAIKAATANPVDALRYE